ncbi:MAG: peptidylprolyl isomerase, partial [Acidobacteriota bacterium]
ASERWSRRRLLAGAVIERAISDRVEPVTAAEVASFYAEHRASFVAPATVGGRAVRLRLDATVPRDIYQSFEDAAARAQRGELTLDQIPERVTEGPAVELLELTALTPRRLASMGAGLKAAVDALAPGEISDVVQEGDALFVFELLDRQAAQPLTQQEAERRVRQRLERSRRAQARRAFEREVLAAEELVALP